LLTCKDFLNELNDFLDDQCNPGLRAELERHLNACPNCFVLADTTQRTVKIFKGQEPRPVPDVIKNRLLAALEQKALQRKQRSGSDPAPATS
jgi:anti-sigma factor (TIGR02949 family)